VFLSQRRAYFSPLFEVSLIVLFALFRFWRSLIILIPLHGPKTVAPKWKQLIMRRYLHTKGHFREVNSSLWNKAIENMQVHSQTDGVWNELDSFLIAPAQNI